ncbi:MAG TPA: hypothetical protein DEQ43_09805 [Nocardioides bacterium]|nr:hypothetical protein [Nocardioides sp.]
MALPYGLTVDWLKRTFLFGVDLTNDEGDPYPDGLFELCIEGAAERIETELGIKLSLRTITDELHDITVGDWRRAYQFQTKHGPLRSIQKLEFKQGDFPGVTIPNNWCYIRHENMGLVEIIAGQGSIQRTSEFFATFGPSQVFDFLGWHIDSRRAGYLRVSYTAGFDGTTYPIPAEIKMAIGHLASMLPLDTAGDLIAGAGIASYSTTMDGLSESVSTTSSATNSGYGARILSYQNQLKANMAGLKKRYLGPQVAVL